MPMLQLQRLQHQIDILFYLHAQTGETLPHEEHMVRVNEVMHQLAEVIQDLEAERQESRNGEIGDSPDRSPPASISPDTPDGHERKYAASFRRHAKLSVLSPLPAAAERFTPLPNGNRQSLLHDLRASCRAMKDYISHETFGKMRKKALQLVVKISPDAHGKHSCYASRNVYRHWSMKHAQSAAVRDPMTQKLLTDTDFDAILKKVRFLNPKAKDPRLANTRGYKRLQLQIQEVHERFSNGRTCAFYHLLLTFPLGVFTMTIQDLGYVPAAMEPEHFTGDNRAVNYSSAVLVLHLRELFESKRLLTQDFVPYRCCKMNLGKTVDYWHDPNDPTGISQHRFKSMLNEVERLMAGVNAVGGSRDQACLNKRVLKN